MTLQMELYEGRNRQIRKMCEQTGLEVARLTRILIGKVALGELRPGEFTKLDKKELDYLKSL